MRFLMTFQPCEGVAVATLVGRLRPFDKTFARLTSSRVLISGGNICLDAPLSRKYDDLQSAA